MPVDQSGFRADMIMCPIGGFNRMNPSQFYEQFFNRVSDIIKARALSMPIADGFNYILEYINDIHPDYARELKRTVNSSKKLEVFMHDISKKGIYLWIPPMLSTISEELILNIQNKYDIQKEQYSYIQRMTDGSSRTITSKDASWIGSKYIFLLGKLPEDQLQAVEIAYVSHFKTPLKVVSTQKKMLKIQSPVGRTPIRFGGDETCILVMSCGVAPIARMISVYGNAPDVVNVLQHRLLTDEYPTRLGNIDIPLKTILSKNRNIALAHHSLGCCGVELQYKTISKSTDIDPIKNEDYFHRLDIRNSYFAKRSIQPHHQRLIDVNESFWSLKEIGHKHFVDSVMKNGRPKGNVKLELADGTIEVSKRQALLNIIFWAPMFYFKVVPCISDFREYSKYVRDTSAKALSHVYDRILTAHPNIEYMAVVEQLLIVVDTLYLFTQNYCGSYHKSLALVDLCRLVQDPRIKQLRTMDVDVKEGMEIVEQKFKSVSKDLIHLVSTRGLIEDNCLIDLMESGNLKDNNIPQVLVSYGTRSDIDKTVFSHLIKTSALEGVKNITDFAIEGTSAKKAAYMNKLSIQDSQYMVRRLKLVASPLSRIYTTCCDNTKTIPLIIPKQYKKNYIDKVIVENGQEVLLTKQNIDDYVNRELSFISPITCRYTDGVCIRCAGRGKHDVHKYLPPNIHIGILSATRVGEPVTQMILSTKHLTKTDCQAYAMPEELKMYLLQSADNLYLKKELAKRLNKLAIRVSLDQMGSLTDLLQDSVPIPEFFSSMDSYEILLNDKVVATINHTDAKFVPYLSEQMLAHMIRRYNTLDISDTHVVIPLQGFNASEPFMNFVFTDDDMVAFTRQVDCFFQGKVKNYTTVQSALTALTDMLYVKTSINLFYVEMLLRAYMITSEDDYSIPKVDDINNVMFSGEASLLQHRSISTKLSYETVARYLKTPSTYISYKQKGLYDMMYGF